MSKHWSELSSKKPADEIAAPASANGSVGAEAAASANEAMGAAGEAAVTSTASESELAGESVGSDILIGESSPDDETVTASTLIGESHEAVAVDAAGPATDERETFLAELIRTIRQTAEAERARIAEDTQRRRQAHLDQIQVRLATEAERMRELARGDVETIDAWVATETKRIEVERERRVAALHEDLEVSLAEHRSRIDAEIEAVEGAIAAYQSDLDFFFDGIDRESDLVVIARQAALRPVFPALDSVAEAAARQAASRPEAQAEAAEPAVAEPAAKAVGPEIAAVGPEVEVAATEIPGPDGRVEPPGGGTTEAPVVGVMAPPSTSEAPTPWAAPVAAGGDGQNADSATAEAGPATADGSGEPVAAAAGRGHDAIGALQPNPAKRAIGWTWREALGGDRSDRDR